MGIRSVSPTCPGTEASGDDRQNAEKDKPLLSDTHMHPADADIVKTHSDREIYDIHMMTESREMRN